MIDKSSFEVGYDYILVTADVQTGGVGTHSRRWISHMPGNVYLSLSFMMYDLKPIPFSQISALAVCKSLSEVIDDKRIKLKWPNDVIIDNKKISGSIVNLSTQGNSAICTIGVGVNVNLDQCMIDMIDQPATSMFLELGCSYDHQLVVDRYFRYFVHIIERYSENSRGILDEICQRMTYINEVIHVHDDDRELDLSGRMIGVDANGFLLLHSCNDRHIIRNGTVLLM